MFESGIILF